MSQFTMKINNYTFKEKVDGKDYLLIRKGEYYFLKKQYSNTYSLINKFTTKNHLEIKEAGTFIIIGDVAYRKNRVGIVLEENNIPSFEEDEDDSWECVSKNKTSSMNIISKEVKKNKEKITNDAKKHDNIEDIINNNEKEKKKRLDSENTSDSDCMNLIQNDDNDSDYINFIINENENNDEYCMNLIQNEEENNNENLIVTINTASQMSQNIDKFARPITQLMNDKKENEKIKNNDKKMVNLDKNKSKKNIGNDFNELLKKDIVKYLMDYIEKEKSEYREYKPGNDLYRAKNLLRKANNNDIFCLTFSDFKLAFVVDKSENGRFLINQRENPLFFIIENNEVYSYFHNSVDYEFEVNYVSLKYELLEFAFIIDKKSKPNKGVFIQKKQSGDNPYTIQFCKKFDSKKQSFKDEHHSKKGDLQIQYFEFKGKK